MLSLSLYPMGCDRRESETCRKHVGGTIIECARRDMSWPPSVFRDAILYKSLDKACR